MTSRNRESLRLTAAARNAAAVALFLAGYAACAQGLSILPVNVFLPSGQRAASLTLTNHGDKPTSMQVRAYDWSQKDDADQLIDSKVIVLSPPLITIPPGGTQVVRLILRQPPVGGEATYRILLDQIPGAGEPGVVQMVLRLSIPIFAAPATKAVPRDQFHLERVGEGLFLVGVNTGQSHDALHDIVVTASDGRKFSPKTKVSPYLLSGATRRWELDAQGHAPQPGETLKLAAHGIAGAIDVQVGVTATP
ncbi:MAG: fimbria/pilus periplasmic chaperone [Terracidiphilus sp.]|jgi:fimbrial chaperone protein